jgi:Zn-dependent membrane protease YugP|tara:strand:- start:11840 stop:12187 length:348 start_codon:yes stop_codon:yes gene_type:complete
MSNIDPLSYIQIIFMHVGGRFLKFKMTPVQEKMLDSKVTQALIFYSLLVFSTKSITKGLIILIIAYLFMFVLLNENSEYNLISKKWLIENNFLEEKNYISEKEIYKNKLYEYNNI